MSPLISGSLAGSLCNDTASTEFYALSLHDALPILILDVSTGEVLAIASLRTPEGRSRPVANSAALVEPNEPGSTAKIFAAAAVLAAGADTSAVSGDGGAWQMEVSRGRTRTIRDVHRVDGGLTRGEAIQVSSKI